MAHRAVFLDRDGTVIADPGYLSDPRGVRLLPGAAEAVGLLAGVGFLNVIVTNQSGVARGLVTVQTLDAIHAEMRRQLAQCGAKLDGIYYCPYHPEGTVAPYNRDSDLRKPAPGMLLQAAADLDIDLLQSWMVGDNRRDTEAGRRAGCRTIILPPPGEPADPAALADFVAPDLLAAARIILQTP